MADVMAIDHRSEVVKTRRGYALFLLGLILPGSAQAIHGPRRLGRLALSVWLVVVSLVILAALATLFFRNTMIGFFANPVVLKLLAILIIALAVFWGALAIHTWAMSRPVSMGRRKGIIFSVIALVVDCALIIGTVWVGQTVWVAGGALGSILIGGGNSAQNDGRYNILLLGSDSGPDRVGMRPDSINVVSINGTTGRAVIFGLPRNLEGVPFPDWSPLHAKYPQGFSCADDACLLNAVYKAGNDNASLYPNVADPGIQATIEAVTGVTGLDINYYVLINMQGLIDLVDAMGGLTITINQPVALNSADNVWLQAGANQHLTGYETLWFARSRDLTSDYARMQRQKCVMAAMLQQFNPSTVAIKFTALAQASSEAAETSIPSSKIGELASLALKARSLPIVSVSFTPPLISPGNPDFDLIRTTVTQTINQSKADDAAAAAATTTTPATDTPTTNTPATAATAEPSSATAPANPGTDEPAADQSWMDGDSNSTSDLDQVCSVG